MRQQNFAQRNRVHVLYVCQSIVLKQLGKIDSEQPGRTDYDTIEISELYSSCKIA